PHLVARCYAPYAVVLRDSRVAVPRLLPLYDHSAQATVVRRPLCYLLTPHRSLFMRQTPYFFFSSRRRHTRCYRDWSSDVCSSDLEREDAARQARPDAAHPDRRRHRAKEDPRRARPRPLPARSRRRRPDATRSARLVRSEERRVGKSVDTGARRVTQKQEYERLEWV